MQITAIQIAAGLSSRMGGPNKLLQDIGGKTLISHTHSQLANSNVDEVIIVTGRDSKLVSDELSTASLEKSEIVYNSSFQKGMTTSIQAGLKAVSNPDAVMICLSDMPKLTSSDYNDLVNAFREQGSHQKMLAPYHGSVKGNPVIFGSGYFTQMAEHQEPNGCSAIVKANRQEMIRFETSNEAYFFDIDTPEALNSYIESVK